MERATLARRTVLVAALFAGSNAVAVDTITTTLTSSGGFFSIAGTATGTPIASGVDGTYTAITQIYDPTGVLKYSGSGTYVKSASTANTISLKTVGGTTYTSGMTVSSSSQLVCPLYTDYTNVAGPPRFAYAGVWGPNGLLRYNLLPNVTTSTPTTTANGCGYQVLEKGNNQVLFAYVDSSNNFVISASTSVNNTDANVADASIRGNLVWDTAADLDLKILSPTAIGAPSFTLDSTTITMASNGLAVDDMVYFTSTGNLPSGIGSGTVYHVVSAAAGSFTIATTRGGTAIMPYVTGGTAGSGTYALVGYKEANAIYKTRTGTAGTTFAWMDATDSDGYGPEHFTTKAGTALTASSKYLVTAKAISVTGNPTATLWLYYGNGTAIVDKQVQFTTANQEYKFGFIVTDASGNTSYSAIHSF